LPPEARSEYEAARRYYLESLAVRQELGNKGGVAACLEGLAAAAGAAGQLPQAARQWGAAEALREALGASLAPQERADHDRQVAAVRIALGPAVFAAAWAEGRALPLDQALAALEAPDGAEDRTAPLGDRLRSLGPALSPVRPEPSGALTWVAREAGCAAGRAGRWLRRL